MIPRWAADAAAFVILWCVLALILGLALGPVLYRCGREMPPPEECGACGGRGGFPVNGEACSDCLGTGRLPP